MKIDFYSVKAKKKIPADVLEIQTFEVKGKTRYMAVGEGTHEGAKVKLVQFLGPDLVEKARAEKIKIVAGVKKGGDDDIEDESDKEKEKKKCDTVETTGYTGSGQKKSGRKSGSRSRSRSRGSRGRGKK